MIAALTLALAAAAAALPAAPTPSVLPPVDQEFAVAFTVDGTDTFVSANAVLNGTIGNVVLKGERLSVYPGTPAYFTGTAPNYALFFDLTSSPNKEEQGIYGASTIPVGDSYGTFHPVRAIYGEQQNQWDAYNGTIYHELQAGLNSFYSCRGVINGEDAVYLAFGDNTVDDKAPEGCNFTTVIQNFNVPGGLRSSE